MPRKLSSYVFAALIFFGVTSADAAWQWQSTGAVVQDTDPRSGSGGIVIPNPAGLAAGNDIILIVSYRSGTAQTWSTPAGWTLLASNTELAAFCRKADAALISADSQQVNGPVAGNSMGVMLRFTGDPTDCTPHASTAKSNPSAAQDVATNALAISQPNTLVLVVGLFNWTGGSSGVNSYPGGATNRDSVGSTFSGNQFSLLVGSLVQTTATNIPAGSIDMVSTNASVSKSLVISIPQGISSPPASAIKFNPGHYAWVFPTCYKGDNVAGDSEYNQLMVEIDAVVAEPTIHGVQVMASWACFEGDAAGDYTTGFNWIDAMLTRLGSKRLMLVINNSIYGFNNYSSAFPNYLTGAAYGPTTTSSSGNRNGGIVWANSPFWSGSEAATAVLWEAPVMDRLIAVQAAYGARYNSIGNFEMWSPQANMSHSVPTSLGYSQAALLTQTQRLITAGRTAWPNTATRLWIDYFGTDTQNRSAIDSAVAADWSVGGNDVLPAEDIQADRIFNGETFGVDYRGVVPWISSIATPELCGKEGTYTPTQLYNHAMDGNSGTGIRAMRSQYFVWPKSNSCPGSDQKWTSGILPFIQSINGAVGNGIDSTRRSPASVKSTYCPTGYVGGCY